MPTRARRPAWMPPVDDGSASDEFPFGFPDRFGLIGESPAMWALRAQICFVARQPDHVLVTGPSGTGKEMVARAIHSLTSSRPMVARIASGDERARYWSHLTATVASYRDYEKMTQREIPVVVLEPAGH